MIITDLNFFEQAQAERGIVGGIRRRRPLNMEREALDARGEVAARVRFNSDTTSSGGGGASLEADEPEIFIAPGVVLISFSLKAEAISPNFSG